MPEQNQVVRPDEALIGLLTERDALHRRLAWVESQVSHLQLGRHDALVSRLASLEQALRQLTPPRTSPEPAAATLQPVPVMQLPVPADQHGTPSPVASLARLAPAPLAIYTTPAPDGAPVGWIPRGSGFAVTGAAVGTRTRVAYQGSLVWVDTGALIVAPPQLTGTPATPAVAARAEAAAPPISQVTSPAPTHVDSPPVAQPVAPPIAPPDLPGLTPAARIAPPVPVWRRQGFMSRLLALVGAGVTLIGVAFLLILAAQYGMFGPLARTISAAALGIVLVGLAFVVRGRDPRNVGAPILAATGVAAGYLSVVTATVIYPWLPPIVGVVLAALIGLGGMVLARLWSNQWVAIISALGSLLLAAYIGSDEPVTTAGLMLVMTAVTLWFERGTGWRLFPFTRVVPTVLVILPLALGYSTLRADQVWWVVGLAVGLALLGLLSALIAPEEPAAGQAIALGLLAPMAAPAAFAPQLLPDYVLGAGVLALVAVAFVLAGFLPRVHERVRWAAVPIGAAFVMLAAFTATQHRYLGVLVLALATAYLAVAAKGRSGVNLVVGGLLGGLGILGWLPLLFTCLDQEAVSATGPEQIGQSLAGIAVVVLGTMAASLWFGQVPRWSTYLSWSMAIAMGSVAIIHTGTWVGVLAGQVGAGFQSGQATVTSAWMVLCIVFLQRGLAAKEDFDVWLHLALAVAALAVAKLFLLDLGMLAAVARVGAFLAVGLLLLFVGTRYAKAWERAHGDEQ